MTSVPQEYAAALVGLNRGSELAERSGDLRASFAWNG